jgi:hypothetical protein
MHTKYTLRAAGMALMIALSWPTWAGDDHGEQVASEAGKALPSVTAVSDTFELVGRLEHDELAILVDRAASNEPVLNATLQLRIEGRTALVPFDAEHGDYALRDKEILAALQAPGHKQLVFTLSTAALSEELSGELVVASDASHTTGARPFAKSIGLWFGLAVIVLVLLVVLSRRFPAWLKSGLGGVR